MDKLKPCPFCGFDDWIECGTKKHSLLKLNHADNCFLSKCNPTFIEMWDDRQIYRWNRRAVKEATDE